MPLRNTQKTTTTWRPKTRDSIIQKLKNVLEKEKENACYSTNIIKEINSVIELLTQQNNPDKAKKLVIGLYNYFSYELSNQDYLHIRREAMEVFLAINFSAWQKDIYSQRVSYVESQSTNNNPYFRELQSLPYLVMGENGIILHPDEFEPCESMLPHPLPEIYAQRRQLELEPAFDEASSKGTRVIPRVMR